jgi:SlyX protein
MESRLTELESRIAFQDHALQELSDVVARQQREIDQLRLLLEALRAQLAALASPGLTHPREEPPPPHY